MQEIRFHGDPYGMNWLRPDYPYAQVTGPHELSFASTSRTDGDLVETEIRITNPGAKPYFTHMGEISISLPFPDIYDDSATCLTQRCHVHLFCGGDISYAMALRMGGEPPHLGLVLTQGSLSSYSVKRDLSRYSNDRGCFLLHPSPMELLPGETQTLRWVIFPHQGREDFFRQLARYSRYVDVRAERYVVFPGETIRLSIRPSFPTDCVMVDGIPAEQQKDGSYSAAYPAQKLGERIFEIQAGERRTVCRILVQEHPRVLAERRCRFLAEHQQYHGRAACLRDAYLAYDNEDGVPVYRPENDYNGGRERIGMGILMARFLRENENAAECFPELQRSLRAYTDYVTRELVDIQSGLVCNDAGRDHSFRRLYNLPWAALFFVELYELWHEESHLDCACRIVRSFYQDGGAWFYPIELPVLPLMDALNKAGRHPEYEEMKALFCAHADRLMERGTDYPASEVNFEQSIVAPAADVLFQVFLLTGDPKYRKAGEQQLRVLEQFQGVQPDYHLYETAIRHWDGYWFGKRRLYGDTFPHYWSALTGNVFALYAKIAGDPSYRQRAEDSLRGVLPLFFPDGSASCAYVFPHSVNGVRGAFFDPYANDQDWGLYFYLVSDSQS